MLLTIKLDPYIWDTVIKFGLLVTMIGGDIGIALYYWRIRRQEFAVGRLRKLAMASFAFKILVNVVFLA